MQTKVPYASYFKTWSVLLILTLVMIAVDVSGLPRGLLVLVLLLAMLGKATLIAANFMHLRYERPSVGIAVGFSLLFLGAVLFLLIAPDGLRILEMRSP